MALESVDSTLSLSDEMQRWFDQSTSVNILFTGRSGVGKSTLINSLVGKEVAKEGKELKAETMVVTSYTIKVKGVEITVWDSPGLQDASGNEDKYIADMKAKCSRYDLVVYCVKMTDTRIVEESNPIRILTAAFGEFLINAVIVLTNANQVLALTNKKDPNKIATTLNLFKREFPSLLVEKCSVDATLANSVPIIPAGHPDMDEQPGGGPALPPITKDWLSDFWFTSMERMRKNARPALLKANIHRFKNEKDITEEDRRKPASEQPIAYSKEKLGWYIGLGVTLGSIIGGVIGIIGGPGGIAAGAAIGGAVGAAAGGGGAAAISKK